jgi:Ca-activated chloride channel family protein
MINPLAPFFFDTLAYPWVLLLVGLVLAVAVLEGVARAPGAMTLSTGGVLAQLAKGRGGRLRWLPPALRALGLSLLVVALAGPLNGFQVRPDRANVIDIMLAVDVSGSMQQQDFVLGGKRRDRLYVTKAAVRDFIESRKVREGDRYGVDRIGLIVYAGLPWTQCPLTLDYRVLEHEVERAQINMDRNKDGTAIGSAIGLAVRRLSQSEAKSKVVILLTDGLHNRGELDPITAAQLAAKFGIRVYTIGAGATDARNAGAGFFGGQQTEIDEEALRKIATITGARYYRATDTDSLREAYAEIDALETTEIDLGEYYEYREAFMPWLGAGLVALLAAVFVRRRWCEVIP